jgi:hypothetical protein
MIFPASSLNEHMIEAYVASVAEAITKVARHFAA